MISLKKSLAKALFISGTLILSACGDNSLESLANQGSLNSGANTETPPPSSGPTGPTTPPTNPIPESYKNLELNAKVLGGAFDGRQVLNLDKAKSSIKLTFSLPRFIEAKTLSSSLKDLSAQVTRNSTTTSSEVTAQIHLKYLYASLPQLPLRGLPDGRDLPTLPDGRLPSLSLVLDPESTVHLYFGQGSIGYYLESKSISPGLSMTLPLTNSSETRTLGYFTTIPKSANFNGGYFISIILPSDIGHTIQEYLEYLNY